MPWLDYLDKNVSIARSRMVGKEPDSVRKLPTKAPSHPGEHILDFLADYKLTQRDLARDLKTTATAVNLIVRGKRGISARMAWLLAKRFRMTPDFWMNLQASWDLWHAREQLRSEGVLG